MKRLSLFIVLGSILLTHSAYSVERRKSNYLEEIALRTIVRQIIDRKLVEDHALTAYLEGPQRLEGFATMRGEVSDLRCKKKFGYDYCTIRVTEELTFDPRPSDDDDDEIYDDMENGGFHQYILKIEKGKIISIKLGAVVG
jgi:hypothetical protein